MYLLQEISYLKMEKMSMAVKRHIMDKICVPAADVVEKTFEICNTDVIQGCRRKSYGWDLLYYG